MTSADKIFTAETIIPELQKWRSQGQKIVFTNGCFDLLHLGHVDYLEKARQLGDFCYMPIVQRAENAAMVAITAALPA